jgi:2-oxoisovalerate dehydrogenase E1 component beta subunit
MPELTLLEAIRTGLAEALVADDRVVLLGMDIGRMGGVFRATAGLFDQYGPARVIDGPLTGSATVGVTVGAALYGLRPIVEIQFADFLLPAFNQIVNEAARLCYRSNGEWLAPLVIRAPFGGGTGGGLYHSQSVEALFSHIPGLKVVIPSSPYDAKGLLLAAVADLNPVLFLEPKLGYRRMRGDVPDQNYTVPIGPARVSRVGKNLTVFAYGMMHALVLEAAAAVAEDGIETEVVDLRTLYPVDREAILTSVRKTGKALIVHEDNLTGGYGAEVAATIVEGAFAHLDGPVRRLAGPDVPAVPFSPPLQDWFMIDVERITAAIRELASY